MPPAARSALEEKNLYENAKALIDAVLRAKPPSSKGKLCQEHLHFFHDEPRHLGGRGLGGDPRLIVFEVVTL